MESTTRTLRPRTISSVTQPGSIRMAFAARALAAFAVLLLALPATAQDNITGGINSGATTIRIAVADFKPLAAGADTAQLKQTFDATLYADLASAGIFDIVSKSLMPPVNPGSQAEIQLPAFAAAPTGAAYVVFGSLGVSGGKLVINGYLDDAKNAQYPQIFARKYSDPTLPVKKTTQARRLPDEEIPTDTPVDVCTGPTYICANRRAAVEIENQFAGRGCVSCHVVADSHAKDIHDRFQVIPVHLTQDYFASARFNHRAHSVQKDLTGDAACLSCHKAKDSKDSSVVMIPDIDNCLQCHRDSYVKDQVTVQCVSCHGYHPVAIMQASRRDEKAREQ